MSLRRLMVSHNRLDHVPPQVVNLDALVLLDVSYNRLALLPAFLADLESLRVLRSEGNPVRVPALRALFAGPTDAILQYLEDNKRLLRKMQRESGSFGNLFNSVMTTARSTRLSPHNSSSTLATVAGNDDTDDNNDDERRAGDIGDMLNATERESAARSAAAAATAAGSADSGANVAAPLPASAASSPSLLRAVSALAPQSTLQGASLSQSSSSALTRASTSRNVPAVVPHSPITALRDASRRPRRNSFSRSMASMMNLHAAVPANDNSAAGNSASMRPVNPAFKTLRETSRRRSVGFSASQVSSAFAQMSAADDARY